MFCHAYRMMKAQFIELYDMLEGEMKVSNKHVLKRTPNRPIENVVQLACAIQYFAEGKSYDIAVMFGISHSSFYAWCMWIVVDAIHHCKDLNIQYPSCQHAQYQHIAEGFQKHSSVGFKICAGAIDGLLIGLENPNACLITFLWPQRQIWL